MAQGLPGKTQRKHGRERGSMLWWQRGCLHTSWMRGRKSGVDSGVGPAHRDTDTPRPEVLLGYITVRPPHPPTHTHLIQLGSPKGSTTSPNSRHHQLGIRFSNTGACGDILHASHIISCCLLAWLNSPPCPHGFPPFASLAL